MLTFDTSLATTLAGTISKSAWATALSSALGSNTVLRLFQDLAGGANPFLTGTEFLNVNLTGAMSVSSGIVTGFGTAGSSSIKLAANLSAANSTACWRIEGNGHFIQGSLGPNGSGTDFTMAVNPTTSSGVGFTVSASISAPQLMPSGTGPIVPALTSSAPHSVTIEDWTTGAAVPLSPVIVFDNRVNDLVFQDAELAAEIGDVGVYQSNETVVHPATSATGLDQFQFGAQMYVANQYNTAVGNVPLYQVLIGCKPYGASNWPTYPGADTYDLTKHVTFPKPFKAVIRDINNNILYTHEMNNYPRFYASAAVPNGGNVGNGTITNISVNQAQIAAETFTITATSPTTFTVSSPSGSITGLSTTANVNGIDQITLGGGAGYTSAPQVVFSDTVGTGATATAFIGKYGNVTSIQWAQLGSVVGGSGSGGPSTYTGSATVSLVGGGYTTQATATVNFSTQYLAVGGVGGPWTVAPTVNITDPTGTGATATYLLDPNGHGYFAGIQVNTPGHGYTNPTVTITGGTLASNGIAPTATPVAHLGALYANKILFTINQGTTPFAVGDKFTINVTQSTLTTALPINSPQLAQGYGPTVGDETRPLFSCGQLLPWQNTATKVSANAGKYFNGVTSYALAPSVGKQATNSNPVYPMLLITQANQENSLAHMYAMPTHAWPCDNSGTNGDAAGGAVTLATNANFTNQVGTFNTSIGDVETDQYLFNLSTYNNGGSYTTKISRSQGWMYEPGAVNGHDWMTGPGGVRFDRVVAPSVYSVWTSNNNAVRLEGNVPFRTLVDNWNLAYFNHHGHKITNVQTFATIPDAQALAGNWGHIGAYYGSTYYNSIYYGDGTLAHNIPVLGISSGGFNPVFDKNGQMIWNGWLPDSLHAYNAPAWATLMLNSPMHTVAQKFRYNESVMSLLGSSAPTADPNGYFMIRIHAWRMLQYTMVWKTATLHNLGYSRAAIEGRWQTELEYLWDNLLAPAFVSNATDINSVCLRNLGCPTVIDPNGGTLSNPDGTQVNMSAGSFMTTPGGSLCFYMSHVLALMKQTGAWSRMCAVSTKCSNALHQILWCLDTQSIDYINATLGRYEQGYTQLTPIYPQYIKSSNYPSGYAVSGADIPANWAAWNSNPNIVPQITWARAQALGTFAYPRAQLDWVTNGDGSPAFNINGNRDAYSTQHMRAQHAFIRRDFFPEISFAGQVPANTTASGTAANATTSATINGVLTQVPNAPLIAACAIYKKFYDTVVTQVAAQSTINTKRNYDWSSLIPSSGILNPPTVLGPQ